MKLVMCSLFDRGVQAFGRPMFVPHINAAIRSLTDEVNNPDSELNKHPEDYDLFELGEFNDADASFTLLPSLTAPAGADPLRPDSYPPKPLFVLAVKSLLRVS